MRGQWGYSGTSNSASIRLHASISEKTKSTHRVSSGKSTLTIPIKSNLQLSLLPLSNEVFFTTKTSQVYFKMPLAYIYFFSVIAISDATLFWGDFNSSRKTYSYVIIFLINLFKYVVPTLY